MINKYKLYIRNENSIFEILVDFIIICIGMISEEAGEMKGTEKYGGIQ